MKTKKKIKIDDLFEDFKDDENVNPFVDVLHYVAFIFAFIGLMASLFFACWVVQ